MLVNVLKVFQYRSTLSENLKSVLVVYPWDILIILQWYNFGTFGKYPKSAPMDHSKKHSKKYLGIP